MGTLWPLLREEVRALPRGRWGLLAAAAWLVAVTLLVAGVLGSEGPALFSILVMMYVLPTLALAPITAGYVASDRSTRFVQSVFTAPVRRGEYLVAKLLPPLLLGALYLAATMPFHLVYAWRVGLSPLALPFLGLAAALILCLVAVGGLLGVLFTSRGTAAPTGAALAFAAFSGLAPIGLALAQTLSQGAVREALLRALHLSPVMLLFDAAGLHGFVVPGAPLRAALALALLTLGAFLLAAWVFVRHQAAETWETTRSGAALVAAALLAVALLPMAVADTAYGDPAPRVRQSGGDLGVLLLPRGGALEQGPRHDDPLPLGRPLEMDVILVFGNTTSLPLLDLELASANANATFTFQASGLERVDDLPPTEPGSPQQMLRVPATVVLHNSGVLGRDVVEYGVRAEWRDAAGAHHEKVGISLAWAEAKGASLHLLLAGLPGIGLCLFGYATRRWSVR